MLVRLLHSRYRHVRDWDRLFLRIPSPSPEGILSIFHRFLFFCHFFVDFCQILVRSFVHVHYWAHVSFKLQLHVVHFHAPSYFSALISFQLFFVGILYNVLILMSYLWFSCFPSCFQILMIGKLTLKPLEACEVEVNVKIKLMATTAQ